MAKKPNWQKIRTEYVTGDTSYKKLAEKYHVPFRSVAWKAKEEQWVAQKKQHCEKTVTKAVEAIGDRQASDLARINTIADGLLDKLEKAVEELDFKTTEVIHRDGDKENYTQTKETVAQPGGIVDQKALRELTAALKDLREVKGLQTELARQEQEARLAILRKQAAGEEKDDIKIVLGEELTGFGK